MRMVYKQLTKQILRNKVFIFFLLLLSILTSLSFFFIRFSIDGNMSVLNSLASLTENQQLYKNALNSNIKLAYTFYISTIGLTAFVFAMFFYRFFRSDKKQLGCLKSLGFKDSVLRSYFVTFVAVVSILGALIGLIGGYYLSDVQIRANTRTYSVTGLIREVSTTSLVIGTVVSTVIFCAVAFLCYAYVRGKEPGVLIAGKQANAENSKKHKLSDALVKVMPVKKKFPLRIALRKPVAILLILTAVMSFIICMVLGCSLNISSQMVFSSQTIGHNYEFDTHYANFHSDVVPEGDLPYLDSKAKISANGYEIEQTLVGLYNLNKLYELQDAEGNILSVPDIGTVYINPGLAEIYGVGEGDTLSIDIEGTSHSFLVSGVAQNAKSASIYIDAAELSGILGVSLGSYNGILSKEEKLGGEESITKSQRVDNLNRNAVSNKVSAIINQVTGFLVGGILIFLALFVNFQDNTRDILILKMMGFRIKEIRKLLIDVYQPIIWAFFILTLGPGILIAKGIQKSLSISTHDYMPFGTNIVVLLIIFAILSIIHWLVRSVFTFGIKHIIAKEEITEYTNIE